MIQSNRLWGLGLDVLQNEDLTNLSSQEQQIFETLIALDKVIITPHVAGWTYESYQRINEILVQKIERLLN